MNGKSCSCILPAFSLCLTTTSQSKMRISHHLVIHHPHLHHLPNQMHLHPIRFDPPRAVEPHQCLMKQKWVCIDPHGTWCCSTTLSSMIPDSPRYHLDCMWPQVLSCTLLPSRLPGVAGSPGAVYSSGLPQRLGGRWSYGQLKKKRESELPSSQVN